MTLFRRIELGRQNLCDVVTQTAVQGPIIAASNYDGIMTAYALLPKELTKGIPDHNTTNNKKKKKKVVADTSKEEGSIEGSPNTQRDSDKGVGEPRFVD